MKTSREQVLEYVRAQRAVTAADISRALQMTEANARHHLSILVSQGLVVLIGKGSPAGKGRPKKLYGLSMGARGHNLVRLGAVLLDELLMSVADDQRELILDKLAERMYAGSSPASGSLELRIPKDKSNPLTQRLLLAVQLLNLDHYEARWEARARSPHIILGHCPYEALIEGHPELCQFDQYYLSKLVDAEVDQVAKRAPDRRGIRQCIFVVGKDRR